MFFNSLEQQTPAGTSRVPERLAFQPSEPFVAARGLKAAHAQTLFAALARGRRAPRLVTERWETPDGDFVDVDFLEGDARAPFVLILHGLEGSSRSSYVVELLHGMRRRGWAGAVLNFRSCSGEPNRLPRSYHSGETGDARWAIDRLRRRQQKNRLLFCVGFSLGANVLLKLLASEGERSGLDGTVAVCVPFDLDACARALDGATGWGSIYRRYFLRSLKRKALGKARQHPGTLKEEEIKACRGIRSFDEAVTARLHGFKNAQDYYAQCSSEACVGEIRTPTLLLAANDDPMVPTPVPPEALRNPQICVVQTAQGGHVGFVAGSWWRPDFWAERQALHFLAQLARVGE